MDVFSFFIAALGVFLLIAAYPFQRVCNRWIELWLERSAELHQARIRAIDAHRATLDIQQAMEDLIANARNGTRPTGRSRQPSRHLTSIPGFVYLIGINNEYYKIGLSLNVKDRVMSLQTAQPYKVDIIHIIATQHAPRLEVLLQSHYDAQWVSGEWFKLDEDQVIAIRSIQSPVTLDDLEVLESSL